MGIFDNAAAARSNNNVRNLREENGNDDKAEIWINVGYETEITFKDPDTGQTVTETRFVNLGGFPFDKVKLPTIRGNAEYAAFLQAKKDLIEDYQAAATQFEPGQEEYCNLMVQMRRVKPETEAPKTEENPFARKKDVPLFLKKAS